MLALKSVTRIPTPSFHCAFTSLCQYQGFTYVAYRQAQSHNPTPPGHIVIQRSTDLDTWEVAATLHTGGDDRDPHLVATDDRLYCLWGTYEPGYDAWVQRLSVQWTALRTYGAWSRDGTAWGPVYPICRPQSWLWSCVADARSQPTRGMLTRIMGREDETSAVDAQREQGLWYGVSYDVGDGVLDHCHTLTLWRGHTPVSWERWANMISPSQTWSDWQPSEPALFWQDAETLGCVVRTEERTLFGQAPRPFVTWTWQELGGVGKAQIHAPAVLAVPGYGWLLAGREYVPGKRKGDKPLTCCTTLWAFDPVKPSVSQPVRLPSRGDCSYPGLVWDSQREEILCSFYSQHERDTTLVGMPHPADVYLARLTVGE